MSGQELFTLSGHTLGVWHAAWSGDSSRIVTASSDGTAKVWDAESGQELFTLSGHADRLIHAAWSGDSSRIVTTSTDGTARIYFARIDDLLEFACTHPKYNLTREQWSRYMGSDVPYRKTCPNLPIPPKGLEE
jgi:WD40 repeat protein